MHTLLFRRGEFYLTSYAQQIQRQHLLNHKLNSFTDPAIHLKMASPKKQSFTFVVQFHILKDRLQQSHLSRMAKAIFQNTILDRYPLPL